MWQRHYFLLVAIRVVFVFKNDITVIYVQYPVGGDGYLVRCNPYDLSATECPDIRHD
jgi:hypothetical protein